MADKVEKILDIKVNYNEAIKAIAEYQTKIDKAKEAEAKLKEQLKAGDIKRQQYNEEMAASKAYINDCNDSIRVITKTMQNQLKQEKAQENSLVSLRAKLSNLTAEYDALSEAERKGARDTAVLPKCWQLQGSYNGSRQCQYPVRAADKCNGDLLGWSKKLFVWSKNRNAYCFDHHNRLD